MVKRKKYYSIIERVRRLEQSLKEAEKDNLPNLVKFYKEQLEQAKEQEKKSTIYLKLWK